MADKKQTMLYGLLTSIASKITYDNTTSGLEADNVQDAIDEVNSNLAINYPANSTTKTSTLGKSFTQSQEFEMPYTWEGKKVYATKVTLSELPNATEDKLSHGISNIREIVDIKAVARIQATSGIIYAPLPVVNPTVLANAVGITVSTTEVIFTTGSNRSSWRATATFAYTKN